MIRLTTVAACLAASALATSAHAQNQTEIAEKYNEEGKALMFKAKYGDAAGKFRQAIARTPAEPKYHHNLCMALFHEGRFGEAIAACNAVGNNNPNADQRASTDKLIALIKKEADAQNVPVDPVGGGGTGDQPVDCTATPDAPGCERVVDNDRCRTNPDDPACAGPGPDTPPPPPVRYAVGRPPSGTGVFVSTTPDNKYIWTLGVDMFGGGGTIGQPDAYGTAAFGLRIKGDYLLNPATRFGAQGYLQITHFGQGEMDSFAVETLDIFDLGIAAYKHLCPRSAQRVCLTPLAGVQLAMMSPASEENSAGETVFNYAAFGGRLELGAQFAFGSRMEHVLGLQVGVNIYSQVFSGPEDDFSSDFPSIAAAGLDRGGAAAYFGIGYTHRFRTPLGSAPFISLQ